LFVVLGLVVACGRAFNRKRDRIFTTACLFAYLAILFGPAWLFMPSGYVKVYGVRDRMMHDFNLDQLREFAREAKTNVFDGSAKVAFISPIELSELSESEKQAYFKLRGKYPFLRWNLQNSVEGGASIVNSDNGAIFLEWGGGFGHWGCSISPTGAKNDPPDNPESRILRASDDIYFYAAE
jgi:hypothetical protein